MNLRQRTSVTLSGSIRGCGVRAVLSRLLGLVLAFGVVVAVLADVVAASGVYPPTTPPPNSLGVTTDRPTYVPGATVIITASNCVPGTTVTFTITPASGGPSITLTAPCGSSAMVTLTAGAIGDYTVLASNAGLTATTSFRVVALPTTGGRHFAEMLVLGSLAIAIGLAMILVSRTRRRHATA